MTTKLESARATITSAVALDEYKTRMGGYLDSALTLIGCVAADALQNLKDNPADERTRHVVLHLSAATQALEPLVRMLCPLTTQTHQQFVAAPDVVTSESEVAGHG